MCILGSPSITLRLNTERPETLKCGAKRLAGYRTDQILEEVGTVLNKEDRKWQHPYGKKERCMRLTGSVTYRKNLIYKLKC
ncbi:hypothetical protein BTR23_13785 [Alkalihalophilus pseudofirmus]|nr:hypothetical protein BTR23_13785 [Alkalihalophilus pseudofirmus]